MGFSDKQNTNNSIEVDFVDGNIGTNSDTDAGCDVDYIDLGGDEETYEVEVMKTVV